MRAAVEQIALSMPPYRPFNTPPLYAPQMRLILLLSALLSAFAAGASPAQAAAGVPMVQVSRLVDVVAARAAVATSGRRPLVSLPSVRDVLMARFVVTAPLSVVPLYAGRLRT